MENTNIIQRIKILKVSNAVLTNIFREGGWNSVHIKENLLPKNSLIIDGGVIGDELRLVVACPDWPEVPVGTIPEDLPFITIEDCPYAKRDADTETRPEAPNEQGQEPGAS